ncbi:unnamed protein product [Boreogadus saida]
MVRVPGNSSPFPVSLCSGDSWHVRHVRTCQEFYARAHNLAAVPDSAGFPGGMRHPSPTPYCIGTPPHLNTWYPSTPYPINPSTAPSTFSAIYTHSPKTHNRPIQISSEKMVFV